MCTEVLFLLWGGLFLFLRKFPRIKCPCLQDIFVVLDFDELNCVLNEGFIKPRAVAKSWCCGCSGPVTSQECIRQVPVLKAGVPRGRQTMQTWHSNDRTQMVSVDFFLLLYSLLE